jgi:hypothetical protein
MKTVFVLFNTYDEARDAVEALLNSNFQEDELNIIAQQTSVKDNIKVHAEQEGNGQAPQGKMKAGPAALDQLLAKEQPVRFTQTAGTGPLYAAGQLATSLAQTATAPGQAGDGLEGALANFGLSPEVARSYSSGIANGSLLIWLRTDDQRASQAATLLRTQKGQHIASYP